MDIRVLRYFLAVTREGTISGAADSLHVTQPTLSRQLMELEEELGTTLFTRGKRRISLTEEGLFLHKRAQEIVSLVERTEAAFAAAGEEVSGDVYIGGGETEGMRVIARAIHQVRQEHPHIAFHLFSGNAEDVRERLDRGSVDFGLFIEPADLSAY
ncbi:LysR family transcriptional regulator, partial [uncultured Desulfovibrio sp.]|uniref:LysR family transcriptional regulator n=1 Tax=uncultured Desulfovibrio sp. TaxID=167968 RepID=UPI003208CEE7